MVLFASDRPEARPPGKEDIDLPELDRQRDRLLEDSKPFIPDLSPDGVEQFAKVADRLMREGTQSLDKAVAAVSLSAEPAEKFRSYLRKAVGNALLIGYGIGRYDAKQKIERGTGGFAKDTTSIGMGVLDPQEKAMLIELATYIPNLTESETVSFRMISARIMRKANVQVPRESIVWDVVAEAEGNEGMAAVANHIVKRACLIGYGLARYDAANHINREVTLRRKMQL